MLLRRSIEHVRARKWPAICAALAAASCAPDAATTGGPTPRDDKAAEAIATSFDALPQEQLSPEILRQALHGERMTASRWVLKAGSHVPMHKHPNEQVSIVLSGRAVATSLGKSHDLGPGDVMLFPPNVEHEFHFTEDSVVLDVFAPRREDWITAARQ